MSGEAEFHPESPGQLVLLGGGVVWKRDRCRRDRAAQAQVCLLQQPDLLLSSTPSETLAFCDSTQESGVPVA